MNMATIDGITLSLAGPVELNLRWVGQEDLLTQLLAAWMVIDERDLPFNPRLVGKPGVGKTTLAYAAAKRLGRPVYLFQATMDTRPEDLIVTPVIGPDAKIQYAASSLVSAMLTGGVLILDEGNRMSEKAWASLAPLLDDRRYVESLVTGLRIPASRDFRIVVTMNEDSSTFEIPEYIHSRLQPQIYIDFPEADEELIILKENLPFADNDILQYVVAFLQRAHAADELYSVRDGINIARYALKMSAAGSTPATELLRLAMMRILGSEALHYLD
ncbi:MAG: MoxR family ATPase [Desulfuromonadaceae bacterium]|nr:MoxR family ATPase [Desulfuromonadaceae bacterium]MDD5106650.1 MoxR family ATPase [Desulfuromonadaceae bacterium]